MERSTRLVRALWTRWIVRVGGTDKGRWRKVANFNHAWSTRHELMAAWIRPRDVVIDLGSGPGRFAAHLPSGCQYIPVDLVSRGPGILTESQMEWAPNASVGEAPIGVHEVPESDVRRT